MRDATVITSGSPFHKVMGVLLLIANQFILRNSDEK
jgi:hypothetical protein